MKIISEGELAYPRNVTRPCRTVQIERPVAPIYAERAKGPLVVEVLEIRCPECQVWTCATCTHCHGCEARLPRPLCCLN